MATTASVAPRLAAIDLNLLVVFDAIMRERSVTNAGKRLGLSQPAMSHALTRLRHMLKDELFIRSPGGMVPTPRADQLAAPIRATLEGLRQALEPERFEPSTASATFRIAVDNYAALTIVPGIVAAIAGAAPKVTLDFRPSGTLDVPDGLDRGELHLALGAASKTGERFSQKIIKDDNFVLVLRADHSAASMREATPPKLATLSMLEISSARFDTEGSQAAPKKGSRMRVPFLSAPGILRTSDYVAILPSAIAATMVHSHGLCTRPLTRQPRPLHTAMTWLRRLDNQPAHAWLRNTIRTAVAGSV